MVLVVAAVMPWIGCEVFALDLSAAPASSGIVIVVAKRGYMPPRSMIGACYSGVRPHGNVRVRIASCHLFVGVAVVVKPCRLARRCHRHRGIFLLGPGRCEMA